MEKDDHHDECAVLSMISYELMSEYQIWSFLNYLSLSVMNVVVVDMVVQGICQPDRGVAPARKLVVVDLQPVVASGLDAHGRVKAVATVLAVVTDALVGKLGRALSCVGPVDS